MVEYDILGAAGKATTQRFFSRNNDTRHHQPNHSRGRQKALRSAQRVAPTRRSGGEVCTWSHRRYSITRLGSRHRRRWQQLPWRQCTPWCGPSSWHPTPSQDEQVRGIKHVMRTRTSHPFISAEEEMTAIRIPIERQGDLLFRYWYWQWIPHGGWSSRCEQQH